MAAKQLSDSQIKRFKNAFDKVFDLDGNGILERKDSQLLVQKWRAHSDIQRGHEVYDRMERQLNGTLEMIKEAAEAHGGLKAEEEIDLKAFINLHVYICSKFEKLEDCPDGIKDIPNVWSKIIDKNDDELLSKEEYKRFYKDFCRIPQEDLDAYTDKAFDAMTKGGTVQLDVKRFTEIVDDYFFNPSDEAVGNYFVGFLD